MLKTERK